MSAASRGTLLYVSQISPVGQGASSALLHRHLVALEAEGFEIAVAIPEDIARAAAAALPATWLCIPLPQRKAYYPPYRPHTAWTRSVRWWFFDRLVSRALGQRRLTAVIGLLQGEYLVNYASWISRRRGCPLFYFYHDRSERLYYNNDPEGARRLREQNLRNLRCPTLRRVWTVCPELTYPEIPAERFRIVYPIAEPIPGELPAWRPDYARPVLAYAGSIYNEVLPALRTIAARLAARGGQLRFYSHMRENANRLAEEFPGVVSYHGNLATSDLCRALRQDSSAFLVAYPDDWRQMGWCLDCFPSKLTQMVQTGLPGLIFAPSETSTAHWGERARWSLLRHDSTPAAVDALLDAVANPAGWSRGADDSRRALNGDFYHRAAAALVNSDVTEIAHENMKM